MLRFTNMANLTKRDLKKLTKGQLIALLIKNESKNEAKTSQKPIPTPRMGKWAIQKPMPKPRANAGKLVSKFENIILPPPMQYRDKQKVESYGDLIVKPPKTYRDKPKKPSRPPPPPPPFNFSDEIFRTDNESVSKFEIISTRSTQNENFKSFTNEFRVKILKKLDNTNKVYKIFQELIRIIKKRSKLSDNDRLRFVIQNEELPNAISTKFNKVKDFALGDLENVIRILEYRDIPLENCRIVVQSVKIPNGKG